MRKLQVAADEVANFLFSEGPPVLRALSFGPDSQTLAAVLGSEHASTSLYCWDLRRDDRPTRLDSSSEHGIWLPDPVLSPDHQLLAHQADEVFSSVLVIDRSAQRRGERLLCEPDGGQMYRPALATLAFDPSGRLLAGASWDQETKRSLVHLWDVAEAFGRPGAADPWTDPIPPLPRQGRAAQGEVRCLAFAPDGRLLVAGLADGTVARWEMPSGRPFSPLPAQGKGEAVRRLAFSPEGDTLAVAAGRAVSLFALPGGTVRAVLAGHRQDVRDLAFHPAGRTLATVCGRPAVDWADAYEEDEPGSLPALDRYRCGKGAVHFWDSSGSQRRQLDWDIGALSAVAFSPDGCTCAVGGEIGQIVLWDLDDV
jgi:WD40 repeat protein